MGVAWYRPEQWDRLREVSADRSKLENTYEEWVSGAKQSLRNFLINGVNAVRVDVDVDDLVDWCDKKGIPIDGAARAFYVADRVRLSKLSPGNKS